MPSTPDSSVGDAFFTDLGIPAPNFHLGVGSGAHAQQMADRVSAEHALIA
jgi:UDP-N-acetylglucosamine 2-epimerase (non-hydrolysing)